MEMQLNLLKKIRSAGTKELLVKINEELLLKNINSPELLYPILVELAKLVADNYGFEFRASVYEESARLTLSKAYRFNGRGKAYHFFVTCLACAIRQFKRREINYKFLKDKGVL